MPPHSCKIGAKDTVSIYHGIRRHWTFSNHSGMYHPQEVSAGWMTEHGLGFMGGASFFNLLLCVALHVPPQCLDKQHCRLHEGQHNFGLQLVEIEIRHSLAVVFDNDLALVGVDDKQTTVASRVIRDRLDLLKDLEGDDGGDSAFVQPHLIDGFQFSNGIHPA